MKYIFSTLLLVCSCTTFAQTKLDGKFTGTSKRGDFTFSFKPNQTFEYWGTGETMSYYGKGTYALNGKKLALTFGTAADTLNTVGKETDCHSGNTVAIKTRDVNTNMWLTCDAEVTDAAGKIIVPRKSYQYCVFVNTQQIPEQAWVTVYHDGRKPVCVQLQKGVCAELTVQTADRIECVEKGKVWEYTISNENANGFTINDGDWKRELIKQKNNANDCLSCPVFLLP